ncbi:MAG: hypothetical protein LBH19_10085, partial [Dysgonamonadaceae bacterium]|nr:hypothetical protein [Dysgonamonadaceae bacterium]
NEEPAYITRGNIVRNEDGSINGEKSDNIIYYTDASGKAHVAHSSTIESVLSEIPAQELIDKAGYDAQRRAMDEAAPVYTPSENVVVKSEDGMYIKGQIVSRNEDGSYQVRFALPTGQITEQTIRPSEIQANLQGVFARPDLAVDYTTGEKDAAGNQVIKTGVIETSEETEDLFQSGYATIDGQAIPIGNVLGLHIDEEFSDVTPQDGSKVSGNLPGNEDTPPAGESKVSGESGSAGLDPREFELGDGLIATERAEGEYNVSGEYAKSELPKAEKLVEKLNVDFSDNGISFEIELKPKQNENNPFEKPLYRIVAKARQTGTVETETTGETAAENAERDKELFPDTTNFGRIGNSTSEIANLTSFRFENGIGYCEYTNPKNGLVDVYMTGVNDNTFVGLMRIYENGQPTNRFTSKIENSSGNKSVFREMWSNTIAAMPAGFELTESTNISPDGIRHFANQLKHGFSIKTDENGNPVTKQVLLDALFGDSAVAGEDKFGTLQVFSNSEYDAVRNKALPILEKLGLDASNIHREGTRVIIDLPVLVSPASQHAGRSNKTSVAEETQATSGTIAQIPENESVTEQKENPDRRQDSTTVSNNQEDFPTPLNKETSQEATPADPDFSTAKVGNKNQSIKGKRKNYLKPPKKLAPNHKALSKYDYDALPLRQKILYDIAAGQKFVWENITGENGNVISYGLSGSLFGRASKNDRKGYFNILASPEKGGLTVEQFAHSLLEESDKSVSDQDILNEIIDVLQSNRSNKDALKSLESSMNGATDPAAGMTESEMKAEAEYQQQRERQRLLEGLSPTQLQEVKTRTAEYDQQIADAEKELHSARSAQSRKLNEISNRNGLFGDTTAAPDSLFGDQSDFSEDNKKRTMQPLNDRVSKAESDLQALRDGREKAVEKIVSDVAAQKEIQETTDEGTLGTDETVDTGKSGFLDRDDSVPFHRSTRKLSKISQKVFKKLIERLKKLGLATDVITSVKAMRDELKANGYKMFLQAAELSNVNAQWNRELDGIKNGTYKGL